MQDTPNPLVQFSSDGGRLVEEEVGGSVDPSPNPENEVEARAGADRTMFAYVPASGCPHPKQTPVLLVLRDDPSRASAEHLVRALGLDTLAEDRHVVVLFPNPGPGGWNVAGDPTREDDVAFLVRCFAALPGSRGGVAGFNGLMFHLACSAQASAMVARLACTSPLDAAGVMVGALPDGFALPPSDAPQAAWLYEHDAAWEEHLARVNAPAGAAARHVVRATQLDAAAVRLAWDDLFATIRRWRSDTWGQYAPRVAFRERGFVAHVDDDSLADGQPHTWFEYVPARLRGSDTPVPLVLYLHGGNCVGLYGAEQSGWADLADRDGFIVVFPDASIEERWNVWDDPRLPSDTAFVLALVERLRTTHAIDPGRLYVSGFSMGSMFAQALACARPEVFAGAIALNGPHLGYLRTLDASRPMIRALRATTVIDALPPDPRPTSGIRDMADAPATRALDVPVVQVVGLVDPLGFPPGRAWPVRAGDDDLWTPTLSYWLGRSGIEGPGHDPTTETGFSAPVTTADAAARFVEQAWTGPRSCAPYHLIGVRRLAHAVVPDVVDHAWQVVRRFARAADGSLTASPDADPHPDPEETP